MAKLSNTGQLRGIGHSGADGKTVERSVRKISNGYVTRESTYGDGGYCCSETFSPGPEDSMGAAHGPNESRGSLSDAVGYLKGQR